MGFLVSTFHHFVFIYKPSRPFLYPFCLSVVHFPVLFLCHLLSLPLFFFYLCPFIDLFRPRLYSPHLSFHFPPFISSSPPPPPHSLYSHLPWLLSYPPKKGRKEQHELPLKNQHANNSFCTQADLPAADRSPLPHISLQSRLPYFPPLLSFSCQCFDIQ